MIRKIGIGLLLGILVLFPLTARSQPSVYIGPHVGMQKSHDAEDANYLIGATIRLKLIPVIGIEGDIGYRQEEYGSGALTARSWPVTVTGLLYPLPFIYGGIGGGWYNTTFDYSESYNDLGVDDETKREFGWHLVAGLELPASSKFRVFGDIRYVFLEYDFKDLPDAVLDGAKSDFYSINVGVLFRL